MAWGPVPASLLAAGAACYFGMRAAWRQKATVPFKAAYVGMCLLGGSGAVLLALPEEDSTRNAAWLDQERAAKIREINRSLPKNVADAAREPGAAE